MNVKGLVNGDDRYIDVVQTRGMNDYVLNGEIVNNAVTEQILISSASELSGLTNYSPGAIAYTAGYRQMWQKAPNGFWVAFE
jgi:hypothetical protein